MSKISTQTELARARQRAMGITIVLIVFAGLCVLGLGGALLNYRSIGPLPAGLQHFLAGGITLNALLILSAGWSAVRWSKLNARYRQRDTHCPSCSYDLSGIESSKCPECGTSIDRTPPRMSVRLKVLYGIGAMFAALTVFAIFDVMIVRQVIDLRAFVEPGVCLLLFCACIGLFTREQRRLSHK